MEIESNQYDGEGGCAMKGLKWISWIWIPLVIFAAIALQSRGEIEIATEKGTLYGTLAKANGHEGQVVVLIAGSGPTDRDNNSLVLSGKMDGFLQLSQALNQEGYSVFRYDKRVAGKSRDSFGPHDMVFDDFVKDAILVVEEMQKKGYEKIHLVGHSQGALVALKVAQERQVASVTHLCGPGEPIDQTFLQQLEILPKDLYEEAEEAFDAVRRGQEVGQVSEELEPYFSDRTTPFLANWMQYDPVEEAKAVEVPILFVAGGADSQVATEDLGLFQSVLEEETYQVIPKMNHVLKRVESESENQASYQDPSFPLDPVLLETLLDFFLRT
jgi:hypothetical protein